MATKKGTKTGKQKAKPAAAKKVAPKKMIPRKATAKKATAKKAAPKKAAPKKAAPKKGSSAARPTKKAATRLAKESVRRNPPAPKPAAIASRKPAAKKPPRPAASRGPAGAVKPALHREDRAGHLDPRYVAKLREQSGLPERGPRAFIDMPRSPQDDLAEELGEETVERATSGEDEEEALEGIVPEEQGGPFVETNAAQEFGHGIDASNPKGAKREPFPRT